MVSALARSEDERDRLRQNLGAAGIETRPLFYPLHTMGFHASRLARKTVAEDIAARGLNLPSWPDIDEEEFELVRRAIEDFF
jgi:perosamine synthetase